MEPLARVEALLGSRPGKVIAVHLNYPSRAAQRGRTPDQPSYFLKPSTSLSPSGESIERPYGCELLAFEGEIALIIGARARRVHPDAAWAAVESLTAGNDFGVYDLRWADKGSNVRSKGGDGFTPIGPALIPADQVDPRSLRVRTWVNDELVQEGTTADLLFPFEQLIADLSQLMTLEPGDVILTGTPAGSTVVQPADVVEVEVDTEGWSTGRLVTPVVAGAVPFASFGAGPVVDDAQRAEAWGSAEAAGVSAPLVEGSRSDRLETSPESAPVSTGSTTGGTLSPELREKLASVGTATLSAQLRKRGLNTVSIDGVTPTRPGQHMIGLARTLRFIPAREDLSQQFGAGFTAQKRAFDSLNAGDVLVVEARGERGTGTVGDLLALRAQVRGAAGIVTDGGVRDFAVVSELDIPVFHAGAHPAVLGRRHVPWETDVTVACGGTAVQPGDVIVGDADGVIVIPPSLVEEVVDDAIEQERQERFIGQQIEAGASVDGLYPMNQDWLAKYREWTP
ncbi:fumarylacetoacetate hydrolase family protein [Cryobacterium sp. BB736]|uniref:fumarylacetoacetate hydrolase family protein n=1 Tax=Cryobacterium sp. BB736 TaxID=2746963 RepID=UPI001873F8F4|nr:fumarylacetoacetate hydrolase family protein [Cryobacterium sp. BB736]